MAKKIPDTEIVVPNRAMDGHDAPLLDRLRDHYGRWSVASAISHVIADSPAAWSTRIGLFGAWGEGKTTVLNFLQTQQRDTGNVIVKFSPWEAPSQDEVWKSFHRALIDGLKAQNITVHWGDRLSSWLQSRWDTVKDLITGAAKVAQVSGSAPLGTSIVAETASGFIADRLKIKKGNIERIVQQLGERRVVIFIDDLDRTDPNVVPKLLLALRELLDFPRFVFVLAFDRKVVSRALTNFNPAWSDHGDFLDKVVDFPFNLPQPTPKQIERLALSQFREICPFIPVESVIEILTLLPSNPRKLKLLARLMSSTRPEAKRHAVDELDWPLILCVGAFRVENEELAGQIITALEDDGEFSWTAWIAADDKAAVKQRQQAFLKQMIDRFPALEGEADRLVRLGEFLRDRCRSLIGEKLKYQVRFATSPDSITWGEFRQFLARWQVEKDTQVVADFLAERVAEGNLLLPQVVDEFLQTVVMHYSILLEEAANVEAAEAHAPLIQNASDVLELIEVCSSSSVQNMPMDSEAQKTLWIRLVPIVMQWPHFKANPGEPELRAAEVALLKALANRVEDPLWIYGQLKPWGNGDFWLDEQGPNLRKQIRDDLTANIKSDALLAALAFVRTPGQTADLWPSENHMPARYILTAPESPLFVVPDRQTYLDVLQEREGTENSKKDALDLLDMFLMALGHGDNLCTQAERIAFLAANTDFIEVLWKRIIASRSQFRSLESLRTRRVKLLGANVPERILPVPDWLAVVPTVPVVQPAVAPAAAPEI